MAGLFVGRRRARRSLGVAVASLVLLSSAQAAGAAPSTPVGAGYDVAQDVAGAVVLDAVACPTTTLCVAGGFDIGGHGVLVTITNGVPARPTPVPGTALVRGIACPTATTCEAGFDGSVGVVIPITNGAPGPRQRVAGTSALLGVACPTATTCEAVGGNGGAGVVVPISNGSASDAAVIPITDGKPGAFQLITGADEVLAIDCPTEATCDAVGNRSDGTAGMVATIRRGTPGAPQAVAGTSLLIGVDCPTPVTCIAVGQSSSGTGVVVSLRIPAPPATTTTVTANPDHTSFASPITFSATVAPVKPNDRQPDGVVRFFANGRPTAVATVELTGGEARFTTSGLGAGPNTVTATYGGSADFGGSTGQATVTVGVTRTLTAALSGGIIVPSGTTVALVDTHLVGSVTVLTGGAVDIEGATIEGSIIASEPAAVRMCRTTLAGTMTVTAATGFVLVGDSGDDGCGPNKIGGSLNLTDNTAGVEAIGNQVGGTVTDRGNSGAGPFAGLTSRRAG